MRQVWDTRLVNREVLSTGNNTPRAWARRSGHNGRSTSAIRPISIEKEWQPRSPDAERLAHQLRRH